MSHQPDCFQFSKPLTPEERMTDMARHFDKSQKFIKALQYRLMERDWELVLAREENKRLKKKVTLLEKDRKEVEACARNGVELVSLFAGNKSAVEAAFDANRPKKSPPGKLLTLPQKQGYKRLFEGIADGETVDSLSCGHAKRFKQFQYSKKPASKKQAAPDACKTLMEAMKRNSLLVEEKVAKACKKSTRSFLHQNQLRLSEAVGRKLKRSEVIFYMQGHMMHYKSSDPTFNGEMKEESKDGEMDVAI